jgi:hypothetical protein
MLYRRVLSIAFLSVLSVICIGTSTNADILSPGTISTCGELAVGGTYTLASDVTTTTDPCFLITSNSVTIDGAGHTITGTINGDGAPGYSYVLQNVIVTGTSSANGLPQTDCVAGNSAANEVDIYNATTGPIMLKGGSIGTINACAQSSGVIPGQGGGFYSQNSTSTAIVVDGGDSADVGGDAGWVDIDQNDVNNYANRLSLNGGNGSTPGAKGYLEFDYMVPFNYNAFYFPPFSQLALYYPGYDGNLILHLVEDFAGGYLNGMPGTTTNATECGMMQPFTAINLTQDIQGNCIITMASSSGPITITGNGYAINGDIQVAVDTTDYGPGQAPVVTSLTLDGVTVNGRVVVIGTGGTLTVSSSTIIGNIIADGSNDTTLSGGGINGTTITIQNSTTSNISANGVVGGITCGLCGTHSGNGGNISISNSVTGSISVNAPLDASGSGGTVTITGTDLVFASTSISATGGGGNGTTTLNYTTLNTQHLVLSPLRALILNGPGGLPGNLGAYGGGLFFPPGSIITDASQCNLSLSNSTYALGANITGDCHVTANNVTLNGQGYSISGKVIGDAIQDGNAGFSFTLSHVTVGGTISASGLSKGVSAFFGISSPGGTITIQDSTTSDIVANSSDCQTNSICREGGRVSVYRSVVGNITANAGDFDGFRSSSTGGSGGTVVIATSTTKSITANGGAALSAGGPGGTVTITNSVEAVASSSITANGGAATVCGYGGSGGTVTLLTSTYTGPVSVAKGTDMTSCSNGGTATGSSGSSGSYTSAGNYSAPASQAAQNQASPDQGPSAAPSAPSPSASASNTSGSLVSSLINPPPAPPAQPVNISATEILSKIGSAASVVVQTVASTTQTIVNSPVGKTVQGAGFVSGLIASVAVYTDAAFATPLAASEVVLVPVRLWGLVLMGLGIRKKARPWGTVYDSVTKQPIDPAYVIAKDEKGNVVAESFTDIDGRYGFLLPDGIYYLTAQKTNYVFPSVKMAGKPSDELYNDLYFGEPVTVVGGEVIDKNIPMDQKNFDWNEYAKKERQALSFHKRNEKPWAVAGNYIYAVGLALSIIATLIHPSAYNAAVLVSYVLLLVSFRAGLGHKKKLGLVVDKDTHEPLSYAIVRVTAPDHETVLRTGVADARGRYFCLVPKGSYFVDIDRKNADGSYVRAYTSNLIKSDSGILNAGFTV